jgi:hypothetical protein
MEIGAIISARFVEGRQGHRNNQPAANNAVPIDIAIMSLCDIWLAAEYPTMSKGLPPPLFAIAAICCCCTVIPDLPLPD